MGSSIKFEYAGLTDRGVRRSSNQDAYAILVAPDDDQWQTQGHFFMVADGMGAHAVGELASKLATDTIPHVYSKHAQDGPVGALRRAFVETNSSIHTRGQRNREFEGMGTTSTALLLRPEGAWIAHVGDSRVYRVRNGTIEQLSFDHSLVWEMARRQKCSPEDLRGIPPNVIVRSLGPEPLVQIDVEGPHQLQSGDTFVLCSDGLSGPLSDEEIGAVAGNLSPVEACQLLIDLANLQGGPDNITAIVVRVGEVPPADAAPKHKHTFRFGNRANPGAPWYHRVPWPLPCLFLGITLAMGAIMLTIYQMPGSVLAFIVAALALIAGIAGVMFQYKEEEKNGKKEPEASPPTVHRQTPCAIDKPLLEKLLAAQATLEERILAHGWTAEWEARREHIDRSEELIAANRYQEAFQEICRGLRILTEAVQRQRTPDDYLQPLWDRRSAR